MPTPEPVDCRSVDGITVSLIDALIAIGRVLHPRLTGPVPPAVGEALADLHDDEDLRAALNHHYPEENPMNSENVPGFEGTVGPGPGAYGRPHVYARDVQSGAGNCVCGASLGDDRHTEAAPGVPVPDSRRAGRTGAAPDMAEEQPHVG